MDTVTIDGPAACATLPNGVRMPRLGLGTAGVWTPYHKSAAPPLGSGEGVADAVTAALDIGYRHLDTAAFHGNEQAVGRAVAAHPVDRAQVFLTTKVWNDDVAAGPEATRAAIDASLERLQVDMIDLLLLHWPVPGYRQAWRVLEEVHTRGLARAIGVSNFQIHHLEDLLAHATIAPMVNQVEFHPYLVQADLLRFCRQHGIQHAGWSPLMVGRVDEVPEIVRIAQDHGRTPFQVAIRWALQHGSVTIPKSVTRARIAENAEVYSFALTAEQMRSIDRLDRGHRIGPDPEVFPANWAPAVTTGGYR